MGQSGRLTADGKRAQMFLPVPEIDLPGTVDGGQAFRWYREETTDGGAAYRGVIGRTVVRLQAVEGGVTAEAVADEPLPESALIRYVGLDFDLEGLRARYAEDTGLGPAMAGYLGLRIMRQDPWECLCGFICSATSNIPRIKLNMGSLADAYGERVGPGPRDFAFPGPEVVAEAGEQAIRDLGWGFRGRYLAETAAKVASGELDLDALFRMPYLEAQAALVSLNGVGEKIADCVLAFSLDKGEAFPVDRWVRRAMEQWYGVPERASNTYVAEFARDRFGRDASYAQQYLFHRQRLAARAPGRSPVR